MNFARLRLAARGVAELAPQLYEVRGLRRLQIAAVAVKPV